MGPPDRSTTDAGACDGRTAQIQRDPRKLLDAYAGLAEVFFERGAIVRGLVYETQRRCGKATCRCATGAPHPQVIFSARTERGQKHRALSRAARERIEPLAERYRRFRAARAELGRLHREILAHVDALEDALALDLDIDNLSD